MALRVATSAALVGVAAGTINLSISDCGDSATHGHVNGVSPSSVPQGEKTLVSAAGTVDTTVADGSFTVEVKAAGVTIQTCTGDVCGTSSCALPANTGSVDFHGLACPQAAGDVSLDFDVTISKLVPSSLQTLELDITAEGSAGKLMCAKINTSPAQYAKGFVRMPRNAAVPVATITDDERASAPAKLDYTTTGATSPVKDQGMCGSCWAFSATQGIESAVFQATGTMPILSTQQIIACDKTDGGCNGGDLPTAFDYVESDGGIDEDANYPDTSHRFGITGSCKAHGHVAKVTDYKYAVPPCQGGRCTDQDEDGLKAALASHGPLSICVNAETWNDYNGGVFTQSCSGSYNSLDHCVQLVGYDTTASTPYWIVKNSWGPSWGEAGHIWLPMGQNSCGIADEAMYVTAELATTVV